MEATKRAKPRALFVVENPTALMRHSPLVKKRLERGSLKLTRVSVCQCKFATDDDARRHHKPTDLWTNAPSLIAAFKRRKFMCTPCTPCDVGYGRHDRVRPEAGAGYAARDAARFPDDFAALVARLLVTDARDAR